MIAFAASAWRWFQAGKTWLLWVGLGLALVGLLWWRFDAITSERDQARTDLATAMSANKANVATIAALTEAKAKADAAVAAAHAREVASLTEYQTLKAEVEHDRRPATGCAPSLADPAPAAMLRALRGADRVRN